MKKLYINLIGLLLLAGCASHSSYSMYMQKPAFYSYIIGDIAGSHISVQSYADVYASPASCQKVITALVALKDLGAEYKYETKLYATKKQGKVHSAVVSFSGDPTLTTNDLVTLLEPLQGSKLSGTLFLDASIFETPPHSHNIMVGDIGTEYGAPVSGINIDKNVVTVVVKPTKLGNPAYATNDAGYVVSLNVPTTEEDSSVGLTWKDERIQAEGNINVNDEMLELKISPERVNHYILRKLKTVMKTLKITAKMEIVHDKLRLPSSLTLLNVVRSEPLKEMIKPALKRSDNLVFDSLYLKVVHAHTSGPIEDWAEGDEVMKGLIGHHLGINMEKALFVDGSGLSRYNKVQPRKLFEVLKQGYNIQEFVDALPSPGEVGSTLEKRTKLPNNIIAKTGGMSGISCLCGYNVRAGSPKAFVFIANSFAPPAKELLDVMDEFTAAYQ